MELVNTLMAVEAAGGFSLASSGAGSGAASGEITAEELRHVLETLVLMIAPFAPYLAAELWEQLGHGDEVLRQPWPAFDEELAREDEIELPVQINGKLRSLIRVAAGTSEEALGAAAMDEAKIKAALDGRKVVKVIVVPGRAINIVAK
jgi:leucyl-tRNA synthetase